MHRVRTIVLRTAENQPGDWNQKHQRLLALQLHAAEEIRLDAAPVVIVEELQAPDVAIHVFPVDSSVSTIVYRGPAVITKGDDGPLCCTFQEDGWIHYLTF